jgi:hypothetical protein
MKNLVIHIYKNFINPYIRLRAFSTLIDIFVIDKSNISNEDNLANLKTFMK